MSNLLQVVKRDPSWVIYIFMAGFMFYIFILAIIPIRPGPDSYDNRMIVASREYDTLATVSNQRIIDSFMSNNTVVHTNGFTGIRGGFYCLWNRRNIEIYPHMALNKIFKNDGYKITYNPDSLFYLIVSETKAHDVGRYSNGSSASKIESIVSIIDLRNREVYEVERHMGGAPPQSTRNRNGSIGTYWSDEDLFREASHWVRE